MSSVKTSTLLIIKIEIIKFLKRKDIIAILGIVAIGFIYALRMDETYVGTKNQSAIFWVVLQLLNTTALFIGPVIMSFIGTQMLSSEIDNNSILLFNSRYRNREKMYYGKSISLVIISTLIFLISVGVLFVIYFFVIPDSNTIYVTGKVFGNNTPDLVCTLFMIYVYTFFFFPQLSLFLGVRFKPMITIVLSFCVTLFCNNVATFSIIKYFNPMTYVVRLADKVSTTTDIVNVNNSERLFYVIGQLTLSLALCLMFDILGAKRFKEKDL